MYRNGDKEKDIKIKYNYNIWKISAIVLILSMAPFASGYSTSHLTHTKSDIGPSIKCNDCHNRIVTPVTLFKDSKPFMTTNVCDTCHSPNGTYDGVNDLNIGAKPNWNSRVYDGNVLKAGKEKWCVGCHDNAPAIIRGIKAPNVSGDVSGDGITYGYYTTGHGDHNIECQSCHNLSSRHIDGFDRTYVPDSNYSPISDAYQKGYRLKYVLTGYNNKYPLHIPRTGHVYPPGFREDWEFALCLECHDKIKLFNGGDPTTGEGAQTNFRKLIDGSGGGNPIPTLNRYYSLHDVHTWGSNGPWGPETPQYDSDFDGVADSRMSCPACHNVHGSRSPAMVRTGELEGKVPALNLKYVNNPGSPPLYFISREMLMQSTGAGMDVSFGPGQVGTNGICNMCHAQQVGGPKPQVAYYRTPIDKCTICHI